MILTIVVKQEIEIDESLLMLYVDHVRERFSLKKTDKINMTDILHQAELDGDIMITDSWTLEDFDDDLSIAEIRELMVTE